MATAQEIRQQIENQRRQIAEAKRQLEEQRKRAEKIRAKPATRQELSTGGKSTQLSILRKRAEVGKVRREQLGAIGLAASNVINVEREFESQARETESSLREYEKRQAALAKVERFRKDGIGRVKTLFLFTEDPYVKEYAGQIIKDYEKQVKIALPKGYESQIDFEADLKQAMRDYSKGQEDAFKKFGGIEKLEQQGFISVAQPEMMSYGKSQITLQDMTTPKPNVLTNAMGRSQITYTPSFFVVREVREPTTREKVEYGYGKFQEKGKEVIDIIKDLPKTAYRGIFIEAPMGAEKLYRDKSPFGDFVIEKKQIKYKIVGQPQFGTIIEQEEFLGEQYKPKEGKMTIFPKFELTKEEQGKVVKTWSTLAFGSAVGAVTPLRLLTSGGAIQSGIERFKGGERLAGGIEIGMGTLGFTPEIIKGSKFLFSRRLIKGSIPEPIVTGREIVRASQKGATTSVKIKVQVPSRMGKIIPSRASFLPRKLAEIETKLGIEGGIGQRLASRFDLTTKTIRLSKPQEYTFLAPALKSKGGLIETSMVLGGRTGARQQVLYSFQASQSRTTIQSLSKQKIPSYILKKSGDRILMEESQISQGIFELRKLGKLTPKKGDVIINLAKTGRTLTRGQSISITEPAKLYSLVSKEGIVTRQFSGEDNLFISTILTKVSKKALPRASGKIGKMNILSKVVDVGEEADVFFIPSKGGVMPDRIVGDIVQVGRQNQFSSIRVDSPKINKIQPTLESAIIKTISPQKTNIPRGVIVVGQPIMGRTSQRFTESIGAFKFSPQIKQNELIKVRQIEDVAVRLKPKMVGGLGLGEVSLISSQEGLAEIQLPLVSQLPMISPKSTQRPRATQRQQIRQPSRIIQTSPRPITIPPTINVPIPPKDNLFQRLAKKQREEPELFEVFVTKGGQDISLGKTKTKEEAEIKLKKGLIGTLRAGGFITRGSTKLKAKELSGFGGGEFRTSKVSPFKVIERKEKRLRKGTTGKDIQYFKKKSGGKKKNLFNL